MGELLGVNSIANRGVGDDVTEGYLNRLNDFNNKNIKLCFIMGGINDITDGIEIEHTFENMKKIILKLKRMNIQPILQSTLFIAKQRKDYIEINNKVLKLNLLYKNIVIKRIIFLVLILNYLTKIF